METIRSAQNPQVKRLRSLLEQGKTRRKEQAFVAEGARLVQDGLCSGSQPQLLALSEELSSRSAELTQAYRAEKQILLEAGLFTSLADTEHSQGILAIFDIPRLALPEQPSLLLVLDQVRDPGNLGTILRTAEATGVEAVLLPPGTTDAWAPKVVRAGMGAHFRLPVLNLPWEAIASALEGLQVLHADMAGEISSWEADLRKPSALLIGGEAEGISQAAAQLVTQGVRIPMAQGPESLNAAVSAAILLYETMRQRSQ